MSHLTSAFIFTGCWAKMIGPISIVTHTNSHPSYYWRQENELTPWAIIWRNWLSFFGFHSHLPVECSLASYASYLYRAGFDSEFMTRTNTGWGRHRSQGAAVMKMNPLCFMECKSLSFWRKFSGNQRISRLWKRPSKRWILKENRKYLNTNKSDALDPLKARKSLSV